MLGFKIFSTRAMIFPPKRGNQFRVGPWVGTAVLNFRGKVLMRVTHCSFEYTSLKQILREGRKLRRKIRNARRNRGRRIPEWIDEHDALIGLPESRKY